MKKEIIIPFFRKMMWLFFAEGLVSLVLGVLVLFYPALVVILTSILLLTWGVAALYAAWHIRKISKITLFR